jgi:hypothetical protein
MSDQPYCGGTGFIDIPPSSPAPPEGECCAGCPDCEPRYTRRDLELAAEVGFNHGRNWRARAFTQPRHLLLMDAERRRAQRNAVLVVREQRGEQ